MGKGSKKKIKKSKKNQNKTSSKLASAELVLNVVMNEYNLEIERSNTLTTRSGVLLSALLAAMMISISNVKMYLLLSPSVEMLCQAEYWLFRISTVLYGATAVTSLVFLVLAVVTKQFQELNCEDLNNDNCLSYSKDKVAASIIAAYNTAKRENDKINNQRARLYNAGTWLGLISIALFILALIFQSMQKGG